MGCDPLPCVGLTKFVLPYIACQQALCLIFQAIKSDGTRYLDVGSRTGQNMKELVLNGRLLTKLLAVEKEGGFVDVTYAMWRDCAKLKTQFIGDLFDATPPAAKAF